MNRNHYIPLESLNENYKCNKITAHHYDTTLVIIVSIAIEKR